MRRLHVLYAGWGRSGRRTSLGHLVGDLPRPGPGYTCSPAAFTRELCTASGEPVLLEIGTWNEVHFCVGRDGADRPVELSCYGDEGAAMLERGDA